MNIFIACSKTKAKTSCKACEMYQGGLFKLSYKLARILKNKMDANIYILSAKYGVLDPQKIISPYNKTLVNAPKQEQKMWAAMCYNQLKKMNVDFSQQTIWLCGSSYYKYLSNVFKNSVFPLAHLGQGKQMQYLKKEIDKYESNSFE